MMGVMSSDQALGRVTHQALWELSLSAAGIGTYVLHLPAQDLEVDDRLLELSALTRATFSGRPEDVYANVHPDDVADVVARVQHALATDSTYRAEYRIVLPGGGHRWVAARGRTLTDARGATSALVGAVYDVTELHEATSRTTTVLETMAVGYLSMDADWAITYVNTAAEKVAQAPRAELVGRSFWEAFPGTVGTEFERSYRRAVDSGQTVSFDAFYPEPLDVWVEVRAVPEGGGLALYFLDVTARYDAQRAAELAGAQVSALGRVALALTDAEDLQDLVVTMAEQGMAAVGADGGSVTVPDLQDRTQLLSYITTSLGQDARAHYARMSLTDTLPVPRAFTTGQRVFLGDHEACQDQFPEVLLANRATGCQAWAAIPLRAGGEVVGVLTAGWRQPQTFPADQVELLETFAAQCSQALQRLTAREAERTSAGRQAALVATARALGDAQTHREVLTIVNAHSVALLGAAGAGLALNSRDGAHVEVLTVGAFSADVQAQIARLPADAPLPIVRAAIDGTPFFLPDRAAAEALFPGCGDLYAAADTEASAEVPLRSGGGVLGTLSTAFTGPRVWTAEEQDLLGAFSALTAQALSRITAHEAEQAALVEVAGIAETLQRSMLTAPPEPDHLQIAVRYAASAQAAEVGGDWYDAFISSDGLTSLVIGDVTGHDMRAAAVMGQLRNLVRGIGFTLGEPPARVLAAVDRAAVGLGIDTVATAIIAQVEQDATHRAAGTRLLRWSNAGHLPPLLLEADGAVSFLEAESDLVLGWDPSIDRHDHEHVLAPGSTVLLYTDGLVERRGAHLEQGLAWLAEAVAELADSPAVTLEGLCDGLLALVGEHLDDDVALLALRAHPEDAPRPVEAGPVQVPERLDQARAAAAEQTGS